MLFRSDKDRKSISGSSSAALQAKTFAIDQRRLFVGSFNLDPRSVYLNTEMGVVVDSPVLAQRLSLALDAKIPNHAYTVHLSADGNSLEWTEQTDSGNRIYTTEPQTGFIRRMLVDFLAILPIEGLL